MTQRLRLSFPFGGISDDRSFGDQAEGTTREAANVRSIDPKTGRVRGAQRAGMVRAEEGPIGGSGEGQELVSITYDVPRFEYTQLTTFPQNTEPTTLSPVWSRSVDEQEALNVETDAEGNVYAVYTGGTIGKFNSSGEHVDTINLPLTSVLDTVVPAIAIDLSGAIYAGARSATDSLLWRFVQSEDNAWEAFWTIAVDQPVTTFALGPGQLVVLTNNHQTRLAGLRAYTFLTSSLPLASWSRAVPYPARAIATSDQGASYVGSAANPERAVASEGFEPSYVSWSPHEVGDEDPAPFPWPDHADEAERRIYLWVDSAAIQNMADGDQVLTIRDRRFIETTAEVADLPNGQPPGQNPGASPFPPIFDDTNRPIRSFQPPDNFGYRLPPTYNVDGAALPTVHFDGLAEPTGTGLPEPPGGWPLGNALRTFPNSGPGWRLPGGSTADAPDQQAVLFGPLGSQPAQTVYMMLRPERRSGPNVLMTQRGQTEWGILLNARFDVGANQWVSQPGRVSFFHSSVGAAFMTGTFEVDWEDHPSGMLLLAFQTHDGSGQFSWLRVNGRAQARMRLQEIECYGPTAWTNVGSRAWRAFPDLTADIFTVEPFEGFSGELCEILVVAGVDHAGTNAGFATAPRRASDLLPPVAGENSGTNLPVSQLPGYNPGQGGIDATRLLTEVERIEGYMAHKWGVPDLLPHSAFPNTPDAQGLYPNHPFGGLANRPVGVGAASTLEPGSVALISADPVLAKFGPMSGQLVWALNGSGVGSGVAVDPEGDVLCVGERTASIGPQGQGDPAPVSEPTVDARKVIDRGTQFSVDPARGAWTSSTAPHFGQSQWIRSDQDGDLYWPRGNPGILSRLRGDTGARRHLGYTTGLGNRLNAIAFDPHVPVYDDDSIKGPQYAYLAHLPVPGGTGAGLQKTHLVGSRQVVDEGASTRAVREVIVTGGDVRVRGAGLVSSIPPGGQGVLDSQSPYVSSTVAYGRVFLIDGKNYVVYDPRKDTVETYSAKTAGEIPARARLIATWRGRIVLARTTDDPHSWHMSALGDPFDWDTNRPFPSPIQAVSAVSSRIGGVPDSVNCLIPYSDDLMIVGCDHSLWRLTGDPLAGGQWDLLSDITGISFGQGSWAKDPGGAIYFFGSRGGLYVMSGDGAPQRLARDRIERRLQSVDMSKVRLRLVWDFEDEGLHIFQIPFRTDGVDRPAWFWEQKTDAWWEDRFSRRGLRPAAVTVSDGDDPDDRSILLLGHDAILRRWSRTARDDDGEAIESSVLIGPLAPPDMDLELLWSRLQATLGVDQDGVRYSLFASGTPDELGQLVDTGTFVPGMNRFQYSRARGAYVWVRLENVKPAESWALESLSIEAAPGGLRRMR